MVERSHGFGQTNFSYDITEFRWICSIIRGWATVSAGKMRISGRPSHNCFHGQRLFHQISFRSCLSAKGSFSCKIYEKDKAIYFLNTLYLKPLGIGERECTRIWQREFRILAALFASCVRSSSWLLGVETGVEAASSTCKRIPKPEASWRTQWQNTWKHSVMPSLNTFS